MKFLRIYIIIYSFRISWIYRDKSWLILLVLLIGNKQNNRDRNILIQQMLPIQIQCINRFLTQNHKSSRCYSAVYRFKQLEC